MAAEPAQQTTIKRLATFADEDRNEVCLTIIVPEGESHATLRLRDGDEAVEMHPEIASLWELQDWLNRNLPHEY